MGGEGNAFLKLPGRPLGHRAVGRRRRADAADQQAVRSGSAVDDLVEKLKKEAQQSADNDRAQKNRKGPANAGGTAIFNEQIASFFDIAKKYRQGDKGSSSVLHEAFFREAKSRWTPKKPPGAPPSSTPCWRRRGSRHRQPGAPSFLNFGKDDTFAPARRHCRRQVAGSAIGEHVGFLDSDRQGGQRHHAGRQHRRHRSGEATYSKIQVLAIRRPPTPSNRRRSTTRPAGSDAQKALQAQQAFDSESGALNQQYLQALSKVVAAMTRRRSSS
jgi:hypothetical protein